MTINSVSCQRVLIAYPSDQIVIHHVVATHATIDFHTAVRPHSLYADALHGCADGLHDAIWLPSQARTVPRRHHHQGPNDRQIERLAISETRVFRHFQGELVNAVFTACLAGQPAIRRELPAIRQVPIHHFPRVRRCASPCLKVEFIVVSRSHRRQGRLIDDF